MHFPRGRRRQHQRLCPPCAPRVLSAPPSSGRPAAATRFARRRSRTCRAASADASPLPSGAAFDGPRRPAPGRAYGYPAQSACATRSATRRRGNCITCPPTAARPRRVPLLPTTSSKKGTPKFIPAPDVRVADAQRGLPLHRQRAARGSATRRRATGRSIHADGHPSDELPDSRLPRRRCGRPEARSWQVTQFGTHARRDQWGDKLIVAGGEEPGCSAPPLVDARRRPLEVVRTVKSEQGRAEVSEGSRIRLHRRNPAARRWPGNLTPRPISEPWRKEQEPGPRPCARSLLLS